MAKKKQGEAGGGSDGDVAPKETAIAAQAEMWRKKAAASAAEADNWRCDQREAAAIYARE